MKKTILKSAPGAVAVVAASLGAWKAQGAYGNEDNSMLMENVEALTSENNPENNPGKYINVCSKKPGKKFCTTKRGNRKWALPPIKVSIYNSNVELQKRVNHLITEAGYDPEDGYDTSNDEA